MLKLLYHYFLRVTKFPFSYFPGSLDLEWDEELNLLLDKYSAWSKKGAEHITRVGPLCILTTNYPTIYGYKITDINNLTISGGRPTLQTIRRIRRILMKIK